MVEHDQIIAVPNFIDQMGGPQDSETFVATKRVEVIDQGASGGDVQACCRLIEDQDLGRVNQRTGDLKTPDKQMEIIESHVADASAKGAKILVGGQRSKRLKGLFFEPTVMRRDRKPKPSAPTPTR